DLRADGERLDGGGWQSRPTGQLLGSAGLRCRHVLAAEKAQQGQGDNGPTDDGATRWNSRHGTSLVEVTFRSPRTGLRRPASRVGRPSQAVRQPRTGKDARPTSACETLS